MIQDNQTLFFNYFYSQKLRQSVKMRGKNIIKHIPNTLTLLNIALGSISILYAFTGDLRMSAIFILLAFHADIFDGMSARILKAYSDLGKELDSLADVISFGLAPAIVLYNMLLNQLGVSGFSFKHSPDIWIQLLVPFLLPVFAALRLAKFNIDEEQKDKFIGLPTPANALMVLSLPLIAYRQPDSFVLDWFDQPTGILIYSVVVSALMVLPVKLYSLKPQGFNWARNKYRFIFLALGLTIILLFYHTGLFLTIPFYFLYGHAMCLLKKRGIITIQE